MSDGSEWSRKGGLDFEAERMPVAGGADSAVWEVAGWWSLCFSFSDSSGGHPRAPWP